MAGKRGTEFEILWLTISYRAMAVLAVVALAGSLFVLHMAWPRAAVWQIPGQLAAKLMEMATGRSRRNIAFGPQQAHFTVLDGSVRVKKANSNVWVGADFGQPLDRGDVVQTGSEGMAKVFFTDGTSYTIKPNSLIVIEENSASADAQPQTQVRVQLTTGTVDLSTASYAEGSSSQVIVAGATASLGPESAAVAHNDTHADLHEFLLKKGSGKVQRNKETLTLSEYDKVSFRSDSAAMQRTHEVGPPTLITPANLMPVFASGAGKSLAFSWTPSADTGKYRLRISSNPYFSSTLVDKIVSGTGTEVAGLADGTYYWAVTWMDKDVPSRQSVESDSSQFTIVQRGNQAAAVGLELESVTQHGHVVEVKGKTDPAARVLVNGQEVPVIQADGKFSYFTPPLPNGENVIIVTAQNAKGGVKTQQKKVLIE